MPKTLIPQALSGVLEFRLFQEAFEISFFFAP